MSINQPNEPDHTNKPDHSIKLDHPIKRISDKRRKTYLRMFRSIALAGLVIVAALIVLQFLGVNVSSMLAGVGIVSIVVGFALQDALKDLIRGLEIVSDNYFDVGDIVKYGDNMGQILSINLRTTKIQDYNTMNIVSIANRNIDQIEVVSEYIYLAVPLPLRIKPDVADKVVSEIAYRVAKLPDVTSAINQGPTEITNSSLDYQIQITCDPANKIPVRRAALHEVVMTFANHKILLPYEQVELHSRKSA